MSKEQDEKSDWQLYNEALSRKVTDQVSLWVQRHADGIIRDRELFLLVTTLWECISGLVDAEVLRMLEAIHEELRMKAKAKRMKKAA